MTSVPGAGGVAPSVYVFEADSSGRVGTCWKDELQLLELATCSVIVSLADPPFAPTTELDGAVGDVFLIGMALLAPIAPAPILAEDTEAEAEAEVGSRGLAEEVDRLGRDEDPSSSLSELLSHASSHSVSCRPRLDMLAEGA